MWPLVLWWALLEGLGWLALPLTFSLFGRRSAHGYPFAKILAVLLLTYVSWLSGFATRCPPRWGSASARWLCPASPRPGGTGPSCSPGCGRTACGPSSSTTCCGRPASCSSPGSAPWCPTSSAPRSTWTSPSSTRLQRTDVMPPHDPWMSGETFNYYYFGYLMFANLARISRRCRRGSATTSASPPSAAGLSPRPALSVLAITRRWRFALLGGAMSSLFGNLDGFLQFIETGTVHGMDYWRSSRIVAQGRHDQRVPLLQHHSRRPASALHGVAGAASCCSASCSTSASFRRAPTSSRPASGERRAVGVLVTFVLGAMVAISIWELPVGRAGRAAARRTLAAAAPLLGRARLHPLGCACVGVVVGRLRALPALLSRLHPADRRPGAASRASVRPASPSPTSLLEFLTVFGALLVAPAVLWRRRAWSAAARRPRAAATCWLAAAVLAWSVVASLARQRRVRRCCWRCSVAAALVPPTHRRRRAGARRLSADRGRHRRAARLRAGVPEGPVRREALPHEHRLQALLPGVDAAGDRRAVVRCGRLLDAPVAVDAGAARWSRPAWRCCWPRRPAIPSASPLDRMGSPCATLDGNAYLAREHPDDFAAIQWLRANAARSRRSSSRRPATPTRTTRASRATPACRRCWAGGTTRACGAGTTTRSWRGAQEVTRMYNAPTLDEIAPLLDRYHVQYVVVGDLERKDYQPAGPGEVRELSTSPSAAAARRSIKRSELGRAMSDGGRLDRVAIARCHSVHADPDRADVLPAARQRADHLRRAAGARLGAARACGDGADLALSPAPAGARDRRRRRRHPRAGAHAR